MKLKELFTDASKWTRRAYARNSRGVPQDYHSPEAVCFCLLGGIYKCYPTEETQFKLFNAIKLKTGDVWISTWNDAPSRTFDEVKQLVNDLDI